MMWFAADFLERWGGTAPTLEELFTLDGEVYREPAGANRRTLRFERGGRGYFLKLHWGVGWGEILKNLCSLRLPVLGAFNEWRAIKRLEQLGVETMRLAGYGHAGWFDPARRRSFVLTEELAGCISLEDHCRDWPERPPSFAAKRNLIERVAETARVLHENGVNHRDLYICHFLLQQPWDGRADSLHLHLIDLHRVQLRARTPRRWAVKDVGSLHFSAMEIGLTRRDLLRFMCEYRQRPLRQILTEEQGFWREVQRRAEALYRTRPGQDGADA